MAKTYHKFADEIIIYGFDLTDWLAEGETVTEHEITAQEGITISDISPDGAKVTFKATGGEVPTAYRIEDKATTSLGQKTIKLLYIIIDDK